MVDSKSHRFSKTLLSIQADFKRSVVWMVSILPLISSASGFFSSFLGIVPRTPTMIDISVTFRFDNFLGYRSYGSQTWPIKWSAVSFKQRWCRYCYMDALQGRQLHKNAASNIEQVLEAALPQSSHLLPITKTIKIRRTRHAGHCWRSRHEFWWTPSHGRAKAGRPARTYIQQLRADTGCSPENLPEAMNYKEGWQERVW